MMYLAIDYGKKRIGLALGRILPKGAGILDGGQSRRLIVAQIEKICRENEVGKIIIGLPIRSRGEEGTLAVEIRQFGDLLNKSLNLPVIYEPEQFTSTEAAELLKNKKYSRQSGKVDELAAVLILEQYLNSRNGQKPDYC